MFQYTLQMLGYLAIAVVFIAFLAGLLYLSAEVRYIWYSKKLGKKQIMTILLFGVYTYVVYYIINKL